MKIIYKKIRYYSPITGITPLYDAASNGHLEVVQLLLDKGAIPSLKTDFGETPLRVLQKWRTGTILTKDEEDLYNNICNKIHSFIDKTNMTEVHKTKTPVKINKTLTPPSTSKVTSVRDSPAIRRRNIINDDTDDDDDINLSQHVRQQLAFPSDDSNESVDDCRNKGTSEVREYKSAISALRNRNICDDDDEEVKKNKQKSALLAPEEVDDDWLDDDLGISKNKKRKLIDPLTTVAKKASYDNLKDTIHNLNSIKEPLIESNKPRRKSRISDVVELSENSSDGEQFQRNENVCPRISPSDTMRSISREFNDSRTRDSRHTMRKKWKTQSTLLKAGFQRKRDTDQSSNSGSETEFIRKDYNKKVTLSRKNSNENFGTFKRHPSGENFTYNSSLMRNDGFNIVQNLSPNIMQPMNMIQPFNIVQSSKNGKQVQTQILPPADVKVQVEDKVLMISLKLDTINRLTISWLVEEVKSRYYK